MVRVIKTTGDQGGKGDQYSRGQSIFREGDQGGEIKAARAGR